MSKELKLEMWENTVHFLEQIGCEDIEDVTWKYEEVGVKQITITLEHPIYLTNEPSCSCGNCVSCLEDKEDVRSKNAGKIKTIV
jgi:hypothetical protein